MVAELERSSEENKQTSEQLMERRKEGKSGCVGAWRVVRAPQQNIRVAQIHLEPSETPRIPQDLSRPLRTHQEPSGPLRNQGLVGKVGGFSPPSTLQLVVVCCPSDVQQRDRPGTELSSPMGQRETGSMCCSSRLAAVTMTTGQSQRCLQMLDILLVFLLQLVLTPPVVSSCPQSSLSNLVLMLLFHF